MPVFKTNIAGAVATAADLDRIPDAQGVYMVGVNIDNQFCPLYLGQADSLKLRIKNHYSLNGKYLNELKELFDFKNNPISKVYSDIKIWNERHWKHYPALLPTLASPYADHLSVRKRDEKWSMYDLIKSNFNTMIYFNCRTFNDFHYRSVSLSSSNYVDKGGHIHSILDLKEMMPPGTDDLIRNILDVKIHIKNKFYYAYTTHVAGVAIGNLELATKCALETLGAYTYACVGGYAGYVTGALGINIDLSAFAPGGPLLPIYNSTGAPLLIPT